ncbi:hypothetical protein ABFS82_09G074900 [Erythranthe guttata]
MAAYAALLSLKHIIQQIQLHPRPPISLHQNHVYSLSENINFLQHFLEGYSYGSSIISREAVDVLESRIADAAHAAEDIIETRVVDQILGESEKISSVDFYQDLEKVIQDMGSISLVDFYQNLEKVIQDMGLIKKDVMEIKDFNIGIIEDHLHMNSSTLAGAASSRSPLTTKQETMVGFDELLIEVMDKLTGQQSNLRIIPIVGMGGIGKTTLARNAYVKFMKHFDIRAWVTISQNYNVREILIEILLCINKAESRANLSAESEGELGVRVHQGLWGSRYLIVMDDIWSVEVWDRVQIFFPDNDKGSRIMITTRLSNVALIGSGGLVMDFLDEDKSWDLLCGNIFEKKENCPPEFEEIGKKIARSCKGLPLSIVVTGGLLAKSKHTREHWDYVSKNLNSIVSSEDNERCLKVLLLSYHHLPVHLKPCFLYMGVFPEEKNIHVSWLVKLWVSEGFLKPINGKSLEVVSREYLEDLCDRNLIRVHQRGSNGKIKFCTIHDMVREVCVREAEKEKFLYVTRTHNLNIPQDINTQRRIIIYQSTSKKKYLPQVFPALSEQTYDSRVSILTKALERVLATGCTVEVCNASASAPSFAPIRLVPPASFTQETSDNEFGTFRKAPEEVLNTRRIVKVRRRQTSTASSSAPSSAPALARTLVCEFQGILPSLNLRLLRVLKAVDKDLYSLENRQGRYSLEDVFQLVNSRFLAVTATWHHNLRFPSSVYLLWNLQTLIVNDNFDAVAPSEIWKMPQLRHVRFNILDLPDPPPSGQDDDFFLGNLQTLLKVRKFKCGEEVVKRIPNIEKLQICYREEFEGCSSYCLNNLVRLCKLESFGCSFNTWNKPNRDDMLQNFILPNSLKKLTLEGTNLYWEDMGTKIGLLPNLQVLKLKAKSFIGPEWETVEGQFCNLRFLGIYDSHCGLEWWTTDSSHFPRLERLVLHFLDNFVEIPSAIGEIPTLQSIQLNNCTDSAVISAKRILEDQEELQNLGLQVHVVLWRQKHLESLASPNFQVQIYC